RWGPQRRLSGFASRTPSHLEPRRLTNYGCVLCAVADTSQKPGAIGLPYSSCPCKDFATGRRRGALAIFCNFDVDSTLISVKICRYWSCYKPSTNAGNQNET